MRPYLFTFWEDVAGERTPGYITLCLRSHETFARDFEIVRLNLENLVAWAPDFPIRPEDVKLRSVGNSRNLEGRRLAVFTGMLRIYLLQAYGGLWLDSDVFLVRDIAEVRAALENYDLVGTYSGHKNKLANCFLGARPGTDLMAHYWEAVRERLAQDEPIGWGEIGFRMLSKLIEEHDPDMRIYESRQVVGVSSERSKEVLCDRSPDAESFLYPDSLGFTLFNNGIPEDIAALDADSFLQSDLLMARVMRDVFAEAEDGGERRGDRLAQP